ncbi:sensor histidine kinase [Streptomyces sp. 6N223]|uniref:sensor histidine kinase n=1 Tax=Streptomyces sp. 6N223 TaxID=3457412 RepID=UPI003FCFB0FC
MRALLTRWLRTALGLLLGFLAALAELGYLAVGGPWLLVTRGWRAGRGAAEPRARAGARRLVRVERRRMRAWYGEDPVEEPLTPGARPLAYLALRWPIGLLGGVVLFCALAGVAYASLPLWVWVVVPVDYVAEVLYTAASGVFLFFLCVPAVNAVARLDELLARRLLRPSGRQALQRRIGELAASRAGVVAAVHQERRRIERDLHDGVQQRLVALGMLLGRARRAAPADPGKAAALLRQAHEESQRALSELREVAWRVYPAALDEGGLAQALETIAERTSIPVRLACRLGEPPPPADVQAVAYFVAAEAVTNAVKHSGAGLIDVSAERRGVTLVVRVADDGRGGADPEGGGLLGLARRVAALDGRFGVDSPALGPTVVTAELPCA